MPLMEPLLCLLRSQHPGISINLGQVNAAHTFIPYFSNSNFIIIFHAM
jgi:hypothetical protein